MNTSPVPRWAHGNLINKIAVLLRRNLFLEFKRGVLTIAQASKGAKGGCASRGNLLCSDPALSFGMKDQLKDHTGPTGTPFARC